MPASQHSETYAAWFINVSYRGRTYTLAELEIVFEISKFLIKL